MATVRLLAQLAGVSIATVSRALRDDPRISVATRNRIKELAALYHYHPNRLAQSFLSGYSNTIGYLLPTVDDAYCCQVLKGVLEAAFTESFHVITLETRHQQTYLRQAIRSLIEQRVAGILIWSGLEMPLKAEWVLEARSNNVAMVAMDATESELPIDSVRTDEAQLAQMLVNHLFQLGHRRIAYLGIPFQRGVHGRYEEIIKALRHYGVYNSDWIFLHDQNTPWDTPFNQFLACFQRARAIARAVPTAIIAANDSYAIKIWQQLTLHNIHIPREMSLVGCGDYFSNAHLVPPLATVNQQPTEIGRRAVEQMLSRISEGQISESSPARLVQIPSIFLTRESCARPMNI